MKKPKRPKRSKRPKPKRPKVPDGPEQRSAYPGTVETFDGQPMLFDMPDQYEAERKAEADARAMLAELDDDDGTGDELLADPATTDPLNGLLPSQRLDADLDGPGDWSLVLRQGHDDDDGRIGMALLKYEHAGGEVSVDAARCYNPVNFIEALTVLVAEHSSGMLSGAALGAGTYLLVMLAAPELLAKHVPMSRKLLLNRIRRRVPPSDRTANVHGALQRWAARVAAGPSLSKQNRTRTRRGKYAG